MVGVRDDAGVGVARGGEQPRMQARRCIETVVMIAEVVALQQAYRLSITDKICCLELLPH